MKLDLTDPLFLKAIPVLKELESHGYEAYFVGGCVRDSLLNKGISDIDIATSAFPEEVQSIFPKHFDVGLEHGTVVVLFHGESYEITTFRTESTYSDYRRPDQVSFVRDLVEDTKRRDFTINAMALDARGVLFDYHDGLQDLEDQKIRAVGQAHDRFQEDALRMMRAIRFASQLGFELESQTYKAIQVLSKNLAYISIERIRIEFEKTMLGRHFNRCLPLIKESHLLDHFPLYNGQRYCLGMDVLANEISDLKDYSIVQAWAFLLRGMELSESSDRQNLLKKWTLSNQRINQIQEYYQLIVNLENGAIQPIDLYSFSGQSIELLEDYLIAKEQKSLAASIRDHFDSLAIHDRKELALNGSDIMQILDMHHGGPLIGQILDYLETQVIKNNLRNDRLILEKAVQDYSKSYNDS